MDILSQQLAGHIPDVPSIRTKLRDPFLKWVPVAQWLERLTGNQRLMCLIPVKDSEVFFSEKKKLVSIRKFLLQLFSSWRYLYIQEYKVRVFHLPAKHQLNDYLHYFGSLVGILPKTRWESDWINMTEYCPRSVEARVYNQNNKGDTSHDTSRFWYTMEMHGYCIITTPNTVFITTQYCMLCIIFKG